MIRSLQIRNYAIIESLEIRFSDQLTIITGETGAGKSILLGALGLIMGERADTKALYNQEDKCVVEGVFDIGKYGLQSFFRDNDLDFDPELVVRREILPSGKSRAFVNDSPVNLKILQEISSTLVDLHQQFDTLDINNVSFQLRTIDALAGNAPLLDAYQALYRQYQADRRKLAELTERNQHAAKEVDFLNFQLEEFRQASLQNGEQEQLEEELGRLSNAEDIKRTLGGAYQFLCESEQSIISQLEEIGSSLQAIGKVDAGIRALNERFNSLLVELQDLAGEFEKIAEETEHDPLRIQEVQTRLDLIYRLQKKHGVASIAELLAIQQELQTQLGQFDDLSHTIAQLEGKTGQAEKQLREQAAGLRERRLGVVPGFERQVVDMLGQLAMPFARLQVERSALDAPGPTGMDEISFLFAANKGGRMQLIKDVASGGELSRLTLVVKSLVASAIPLPTLIFDEIDTGVSGDVALKMGNILRRLSRQHQVVSITHSPQIASKADAHFFVYKVEKEDRTVTNVRLLNEDERVRAIATMLSQSPPSDSAMENARELIAASEG